MPQTAASEKGSILFAYIEDLTQVVILYEVYKTSLQKVSYIWYEMTMSVRFCLSYDPLKWHFIAFKMKNISRRKSNADLDFVNDVTCMG